MREPEPAARRLLELLHAQRLAEGERNRHLRSSDAWVAASERLDELNARIWQLASSGTEPAEDFTTGVHAALEAEPEDDMVFRRAVLASLRRAYADRPESAAQRMRDAGEAVASAQGWLRREYPEATITAEPTDAPDTILVHAERDRHVHRSLASRSSGASV